MYTQKSAVLLKASTLLLMAGAVSGLFGQTSVKVVNTPNVHVTNTPSVTVANTPTVVVGNTPNVNVATSATKPLLNSSIDDPGRVPFQSSIENAGKCSGDSCLWLFGPIPAGHRLVVQHVSGSINFNAPPGAAEVLLNNGTSTFFAPLNSAVLFSAFDQPVLAFFDGPQSIGVQILVFGGGFATGPQTQDMTLTGYLLDCSAAPCAPIAH